MKSLIVYFSKYGAGAKCVDFLQSKLTGEVSSVNLKTASPPVIDGFDRIIIGSNVHAGSINRKIKSFCSKNTAQLMEKEFALFLCCLTPEEKAQELYEKNFPPELVQKAKARAVLGGALYFEKMNFLERSILKKISGSDQNIDQIDTARIAQFAEEIES